MRVENPATLRALKMLSCIMTKVLIGISNLGQAAESSALHLLSLTAEKMINIPKIILLAEVDVPISWKLIFEKVLKILEKKKKV